MARWILAPIILIAAPLFAQDANPPQQKPPANPPKMERERPPEKTSDKEVAPPEEDTSVGTTTYSFNPLQAKKDIEAGNFYAKAKHDYRAAANRFISATKYNDGDAEAWLRLGEMEEKLKDPKAAKDAYQKYLEIASDAKNAGEIRKRIDKLK
jgi:tetratricopeptide (TPR) repeat protein